MIHVWYIYLYIYHKNQPNLGKYTSPMDIMEWCGKQTFHRFYFSNAVELEPTTFYSQPWTTGPWLLNLNDSGDDLFDVFFGSFTLR